MHSNINKSDTDNKLKFKNFSLYLRSIRWTSNPEVAKFSRGANGFGIKKENDNFNEDLIGKKRKPERIE